MGINDENTNNELPKMMHELSHAKWEDKSVLAENEGRPVMHCTAWSKA